MLVLNIFLEAFVYWIFCLISYRSSRFVSYLKSRVHAIERGMNALEIRPLFRVILVYPYAISLYMINWSWIMMILFWCCLLSLFAMLCTDSVLNVNIYIVYICITLCNSSTKLNGMYIKIGATRFHFKPKSWEKKDLLRSVLFSSAHFIYFSYGPLKNLMSHDHHVTFKDCGGNLCKVFATFFLKRKSGNTSLWVSLTKIQVEYMFFI